MRDRFQEELMRIGESLAKMGELCIKGIASAIEYLASKDPALEEEIRAIENDTDELESEIEAACLKVFIREQPVARDMRMLSAALKMISDMERIGDHAVDIAEVGKYVAGTDTEVLAEIEKMSAAASAMLKDSVKAYVQGNVELADEVMRSDDTVDNYFAKVKDKIIDDIRKGLEDAAEGLDYLMIAKYLERIADHAVNISEWAVFSVTGEHVKYD